VDLVAQMPAFVVAVLLISVPGPRAAAVDNVTPAGLARLVRRLLRFAP
jgi:hypothetical protein